MKVDAAVVLAADVSRSVDDGEFVLERRGYAEAIQSQKLLDGFVRVTAGRLRVAQHATLKRHSSREGAPLGQCGRASLLVNSAGNGRS